MTRIEAMRKLNRAIELGYIQKSIDTDGVVRYALTQSGYRQWLIETALNQHKEFNIYV